MDLTITSKFRIYFSFKFYKRVSVSALELFPTLVVKGTHKEKAPSNKTLALWVVGTSNQLFLRGSWTKTKFSKK